MKSLAIIGAGPMGLALGYFLAQQGFRPVIFEADDRPGGMSATFDFDGLEIERYYHFINRPDVYLFDLLKDLGLYDLLKWRQTKMGYYIQNSKGRFKLHAWGNPFALLRFDDAPLISRLRYGFHVFRCKFLKDLTSLDNVSAKDWIVKWEGERGYDFFWRALFEKKFYEYCDPLSAAWIASRIRRVANSRDSIFHESLGYLEGGTIVLIKALVDSILEGGGSILYNHLVKRVIPKSEGLGAKVITQNDEEYLFDLIISTIPLPYLNGIIDNLPNGYQESLDKIVNVGCICVLFKLQTKLTDNFWLNIDVKSWDIPGIIEYSNLCPMPCALIYLPFYCPTSHPNWLLDDVEIVEKAITYIKKINAEATSTLIGAAVNRYKYAQPVCPPGFLKQIPDMHTGLDGILAADTTHSYFEDRSINESTFIAKKLCDIIISQYT
ncbi:MAG: NAD(P)/FAD-dependent oxidoreductase [Endomicrobium sp.]|jgi:protoporphyrinogen oxidase|nr:NAD(P)/FAD-dependent oxidoreductase [Endomicrobium sp.]